MTETPPSGSGNRWEPSGEPTDEQTEQTEQSTAAVPAAEPVATTTQRRPTRSRRWLAGGAAAVLLTGGVGGFAIGRATAGGEDRGRVDRQGIPAGFDQDGDGRGLDGGPVSGFEPGEGFVPPNGQPPGRDDEDDGTDGSNT